MAKFYGAVGFADVVEVERGKWKNVVTERLYHGTVLKINRRTQPGESIIDNIVINNEISIIADPFADQNLYKLIYVNWMGVNWKITSVVVQRPRIILSIGGVYNGEMGPTTT